MAAKHRSVVKVAIVGGGCAGIATAWHLSELNLAKGAEIRYDITVFEKSWRLGGKGASGRDRHGRILEHGLHIWLGFYENAFKMVRDCYRLIEKDPSRYGPLPHRAFDDAFFPEPHVGVAAKRRSGEWQAWTGHLPPMKGLPGDPLDPDTNPFTLAGYLTRCIGLLKALLHSVLDAAGGDAEPGAPRPNDRSSLDEEADLDFSFDPTRSPAVLVERMAKLLRFGALAGAAGILQGATIVETMLGSRKQQPSWNSTVLEFLQALATQTRKQLRDFVDADEPMRRKTEVIDLIMTIVVGLYRDRVLFDKSGLDAINDIDCKKWLLQHGALETSVNSPFVTGLYDLAFCYEDGDRSRPALAAGQALRGALRMFFTYRGSLFWRMRSGMGDAVFAPLYRVLRERDVEFRFRHELARVEFDLPTDGDKRVARLRFNRLGGGAQLRRLNKGPLDHLGCWPHEFVPNGQQDPLELDPLNEGEGQGRQDEGFHVVVLALGIEDFKTACAPEFFRKMPRWDRMVKNVKTVATQAAQVWTKRSLDDLGWRRGAVLVSAFDGGAFETWADMTHTLPTERRWRCVKAEKAGVPAPDDAVQSIAYFCGVLPEAKIAKAPRNRKQQSLEIRAHESLKALLSGGIAPLWPKALDGAQPGGVMKGLLSADGQRDGQLSDQHVQVNFKGSDRYTLALPKSLQYRISPLDCSVVNMTIAGDWTECGFNEGCVESAVMSGMLAAHAISGKPDLDQIIGYHHP